MVLYELLYYGKDTGTPVDITKYVETIDKFTDVGTGEIASAKITLDSRFGEFITQDSGGATPIIKQYDLFKLTIASSDALNINDQTESYWRYLIQDDVIPVKNETGTHLILELFGRERFLQKAYAMGHYYFRDFQYVAIDVLQFSNSSIPNQTPRFLLDTGYGTIPTYTFGVFDFGDKTTIYDALMEIVNRLSLPVASGGGGEHYGIRFRDDPNDIQIVRVRIAPRGAVEYAKIPSPPITITEVKEPSEGNVVVVKGQKGAGSIPASIAEFRSLIEEFRNLPRWYEDGPDYQEIKGDTIIREDDSKAYRLVINIPGVESITVSRPSNGDTSWQEVTFADYVKQQTGADPDKYQYSPWTDDKVEVWKNMGGNPSSYLISAVPSGMDSYNSFCFTDSNLVIRDNIVWRDWVDCRESDPVDIPSEFGTPYFGFRCLVDATGRGEPTGDFATTDKFGNSYRNAIVMMDRDGDWIVWRSANDYDECVVLNEGRVYTYTGPLGTLATNFQFIYGPNHDYGSGDSTKAWRDTSKVLMGNDCFHYPSAFTRTDGLIGDGGDGIVSFMRPNGTNFTTNTALKITYTFGENEQIYEFLRLVTDIYGFVRAYLDADGNPPNLSQNVADIIYSTGSYTNGWWATLFETPFPKSTYNGIIEDVGELFYGNLDGDQPLLDLYNYNFTPSRQRGYDATDGHLLGPIDGIKLLFNFNMEGIDIRSLLGEMPFRCVVYDILGNVWTADTTYRFQQDTQELHFPFSSFRLYRARLPIGYTFENITYRIINPELKITEIFERRYIKRISLHSLMNYDDQGRFDPWTWEGILRKIITILTGKDVTYTGTVDAFHFTKTPVAVARDKSSLNNLGARRLIGRIREYPGITNVRQLQKIADSELEIAKFQFDTWNIKYEDTVYLQAERAFFVQDRDFISSSEKAGLSNTKRLIIRKITYTVGDRSVNSGLTTTVEAFRQVGVN